jgi:hypothetical protein
MSIRLCLVAGLFAAAMALAPGSASALPIAAQSGALPAAAAEGTLVDQAGFRPRRPICRAVRAECRARWGGGPRFWRCVARRGC